MTSQLAPATNRKSLSHLQDLPRSPAASYLRKQTQPKVPKERLVLQDLQPAPPESALQALIRRVFPAIGRFSPTHAWDFVTEYFRHRLGRRHDFAHYAAGGADNGIYRMPADGEIRIALAGDWGTGTNEAEKIGQLITAFGPHYSIHLGDIYYVGDLEEVNENFLGIPNPANEFAPCLWPNGSIGAFTLNGNHEMYSLGTAYFDNMLPALGIVDGDKPRGQGASFFCLENDHWRIVAVDTGYNSIGLPLVEYLIPPNCALPDELIEWLRTQVKPAPDDPRGIIILSHHQYFSCFESWNTKPAKQLAEFFQRPVLWFWGHEHRMTIYERYDGTPITYGRCIGHGGMPIELPPLAMHTECRVEFVDGRRYPNEENLEIGYNGFARLTLQGERLHVDYVDVAGTVIFTEDWVSQGGEPRRTASKAFVPSAGAQGGLVGPPP
jgi:hypothetical protein